jgi:hypothetical protein
MNNYVETPEFLPASNKNDSKTYTDKDTKPGHQSKSTDDLQFKSAKVFPNFKPKVDADVATMEGAFIFKTNGDEPKGTVVQWALPMDDIEEGKKYKFDVKLKVGHNVDSKDILDVDWVVGAGDLDALSEIVVK